MAELPSTPLSLVTSEAPKSAVSPSQVAAPFAELGQSLEKVGEGLGQIAEPFAEQAGYKAVSRDENGNLTYQHAPIIGPAGAAFARAAKFTALAEASGDARRDDIAMSKQFLDNPDGYAAAAAKYRDTMVQKYSQVSPEVGAIIGRQIDSQTTFNYRYLQNEHQRLTTQRFQLSSKASIESDTDDLLSIVKSTGSSESPEAQKKLLNIVAAYHERVNNPAIAYPQELADRDLKGLDLQIGSAKFQNKLDKVMADPNQGTLAAMDMVEKMRGNQSVSPTEREFYATDGEKYIRATQLDEARRGEIMAKQQKAYDESQENAIIADSANPNPTITANDIKSNQNMSPEAKMRMLAWQHRDGAGEPIAQVSQRTSSDLFRRMNLPEGDPERINDLGKIREAYAPPDGSRGGLTRTDEEWLEKRFKEDRSPEGVALAADRSTFFKRHERMIDGAMDLQGHSALGDAQIFKFQQDAARQEGVLRAQGKDPHLLYDPDSEYFLGKPSNLAKYHVSMQDSQKYTKELDAGKSTPSQTAPAINDLSQRRGWNIPGGTFTPENISKLVQQESGGRNLPPNQYGYAGYFQMKPSEFGLTPRDFAKMSFDEQLNLYANKYLTKYGYTGKEDLAVMNAAPAFKNASDNQIAYPAGSLEAQANPAWMRHSNAGGAVTVGGIKAWAGTGAPKQDRMTPVTSQIVSLPEGITPERAMSEYPKGTKIRLPDGRIGTVP